MKMARKIGSAVLAILTAVLLFLPWGTMKLGGEVRLGDGYSNPIVVKGTYLRGVAASIRQLSEDLNGFQEQAQFMELIIMTLLIFLAVLEVIYAITTLCGLRMNRALGVITRVLVTLVIGTVIIFGIWEPVIPIADGLFRIVSVVHLNLVPVLILILEYAGKMI